jgi:glutaminyl-peptide cyclotransferase
MYTYEIVREYPHDPAAYTQGLQWVDGMLVEGTGQVGESSLRRVELVTGRVTQKRDVPAPYFGEGTLVFGDTLYQLTWTHGIAFLYDPATFAPLGEFRYEGEGWGLTTDGSRLVMSNGTARIVFRDPATFEATGSITVTDNGTPVNNLNELEWVNGELWANVWTSDQIARIDPATGAVTGWIDLKGILPNADRRGREDVLNGIAYDAENDRIFVTGKYWPKLYEIRVKAR